MSDLTTTRPVCPDQFESFADVDGGRITLRTRFANLLLCKRIPGATWDISRKVWTYPATKRHADLVRRTIPNLKTSETFDALLGAKPAAAGPEVPAGLTTSPWRHQIVAFRFAMLRFLAGVIGVLLAMGMGTGKTLVTFMIFLGLEAKRVLVCSPLRVVQVWATQLARHVSIPLIVVALDEDAGSVAEKQRLAEEKLKLAETTGKPFIAIINYDSIWREPFASWALKQQWDLVIADESHKLKQPGGKASLYFKRLRARATHRLALTGTPMPHSPLDVYAQFRYIAPEVFGPSFNAFRQKYAVMGGFQNKQVTGFQSLDELESLMRAVTFRVGKDVLDLPPQTSVTYPCVLSPEAQRIYNAIEDDFVAEVHGGTITIANAMTGLLRLEQLTGGWVKTDDGQHRRVDHAKQRLLEDTLEDIGPGEPVVVFCRFHHDLDAVHEACKALGFTSLELSGRHDELQDWQAGKAQVLAVQISSGGTGVDLTRARYSIYYSLSFSLGEYDQSLSRVHRPGQTRPVEHIHLIARHTVDEKILRALEKRAEVIEAILAEIKG